MICFLKEVGSRLKKNRKIKGLTQLRLATEAQIDLRNYQEIESGKRNFNILTIEKIAKVLNITLNELFRPSISDELNKTLPTNLVFSQNKKIHLISDFNCEFKVWNKLSIPLAIIDDQGSIFYANNTWLLQYKIQNLNSVLILKYWDLFEQPYHDFLKAAFNQVLSTKQSMAPFIVRHKNLDDQNNLIKICWHTIKLDNNSIAIIELTWIIN